MAHQRACDKCGQSLPWDIGKTPGGDTQRPLKEPTYTKQGLLACGGTNRQNGERCKKRAGTGTDHLGYGLCDDHFGNTVNGEKNAARLQLHEHAEILGRAMWINPDAPPITDAGAQLQIQAGILVDATRRIQDEINAMGSVVETPTTGAPFIKPLVLYWKDLMKMQETVLTNMAKLGLEDRRVRLEEAQVTQLVGGIQRILAALVLTAEQQAVAHEVVPRELRVISGELGSE